MKTKNALCHLLSLALCLVLVLSLLPASPVFADSTIVAQGSGWKLDSDGKLTITGAVQNPSTGNDETPWKNYKSQIKTVYAESSAWITNFTGLFSKCTNLVSVDLSRMSRTPATSAAFMFSECTSLTEVRFSSSPIDTASLTSMSHMFQKCSSLVRVDLHNWNVSSVTDMSYLFYDCSSLTNVNLSGFDTSKVTDMSMMFYRCSALKSLDISHFDISSAQDVSGLLTRCSALEILTLHDGLLDWAAYDLASSGTIWANMNTGVIYPNGDALKTITGKVTLTKVSVIGDNWFIDAHNQLYLTGPVSNPSSATVGDLTPWRDYKTQITGACAVDGASIDNGLYLLAYCSKMQSVDLTKLDTSAVTDFSYMFALNTSYYMDLTGMVTSRANTTSSMFVFDPNLQFLTIDDWDTSHVTDMSGMFYGCTKLNSLDLTALNTSCVTNYYMMFSNCTALKSLDISTFDTSKSPNTADMLKGCSALTSLGTNQGLLATTADQVMAIADTWTDNNTGKFHNSAASLKTITGKARLATILQEGEGWYLDGGGCLHLIGAVHNPSADIPDTPWNFCKDEIKSVKAEAGSSIDNGILLFAECYALTDVDLRLLDTSRVKSMEAMFIRCQHLKTVDLSGINTSNVVNMSQMFDSCYEITSLNLRNINTAKVTDMHRMFANVMDLESLDLGGFNTSNVTNMRHMFSGCNCLTSLNLSTFDTSNVTTMESMFEYCNMLPSLNLRNFNTGKVTNMDYMFYYCLHLTSLDLSNFNTAQVTSMIGTFEHCANLVSLNVSTWNTGNVIDMYDLFCECSSLVNLDVSRWNTASVQNMPYLFDQCSSLTKLDLSGWNTSSVENMACMFRACSGLRSLNISSFDISKVDTIYYFLYGCTDLQELTINPALLRELAYDLLGLQPQWINKATGQVYSTEAELEAITSTVTLVTKNNYNPSCGGDRSKCPLAQFTDAPGYSNWAHAGIEFCVRRGLMSGTSATTFGPKLTMSRSMLVTVLYRMAGQPGAGSTKFSDVPAGQWYSAAVSWAADHGIVSGVGGGRFDPNGSVTREQLATILYRYAGYKGYDTSKKDNLSGFADAGKVGTWFVDGMKWAVAENLITGSAANGKTYLTPQGAATREQVAAILMRFIQNIGD